VGDEPSIPSQHRVGLGNTSHLPKRSASQTLSDLRQRRVCEPESGGQLGAKNAVFRREVLISQKEFLVDRSRDIRQQSQQSTVSHRDQSYTIYVS
jgi:hypothetical protein